MRIQKIEEKFGVVFSEEAMQALHLSEGADVEVLPVSSSAPVIQYASLERVMESYRKTLPDFREAYAELAK